MMTDLPADLTDLARFVVTLPWWRWMAGMVTVRGQRYLGAPGWGSTEPEWHAPGGTDPLFPAPLPDLCDPATVGCMLSLVREATRTPGLYVRCYEPSAPDMSGVVRRRWRCMDAQGRRAQHGDYRTEAHALAALWVEVTP